jgi:hypothetical protein
LHAAIVTTFTVVCSVQIVLQVWAPASAPADVSCREGILQLIGAIRRARVSASKAPGGESEELSRFRNALEPEWSTRPGLSAACASDAEALSSLGDVDRLRYAEEHALRYEALDVAERRQRVSEIESRLNAR